MATPRAAIQAAASPPLPPAELPYQTHYEVLEVPEDATLREIKASYISKALVFHPDRSRDPATGLHWTRISAAWAMLSDVAARQAYDKHMPVRKAVIAFYAMHNKTQLQPHLVERIVKSWQDEPVKLFAKLQEKYDVQPFVPGSCAGGSADSASPFCCSDDGSCGGFGRTTSRSRSHAAFVKQMGLGDDDLEDDDEDDDNTFSLARSPGLALTQAQQVATPAAKLASQAKRLPASEKKPVTVEQLLKSEMGGSDHAEEFMRLSSEGPGADLADWDAEQVAEHLSGLGPKFRAHKQAVIDYGINGVFLLFDLEAVHLEQLGFTDRLARARVLSEVTQLRMRWYTAMDAKQAEDEGENGIDGEAVEETLSQKAEHGKESEEVEKVQEQKEEQQAEVDEQEMEHEHEHEHEQEQEGEQEGEQEQQGMIDEGVAETVEEDEEAEAEAAQEESDAHAALLAHQHHTDELEPEAAIEEVRNLREEEMEAGVIDTEKLDVQAEVKEILALRDSPQALDRTAESAMMARVLKLGKGLEESVCVSEGTAMRADTASAPGTEATAPPDGEGDRLVRAARKPLVLSEEEEEEVVEVEEEAPVEAAPSAIKLKPGATKSKMKTVSFSRRAQTVAQTPDGRGLSRIHQWQDLKGSSITDDDAIDAVDATASTVPVDAQVMGFSMSMVSSIGYTPSPARAMAEYWKQYTPGGTDMNLNKFGDDDEDEIDIHSVDEEAQNEQLSGGREKHGVKDCTCTAASDASADMGKENRPAGYRRSRVEKPCRKRVERTR